MIARFCNFLAVIICLSGSFAHAFPYQRVAEANSLRIGGYVFRYMRLYSDPCLYIQRLAPESNWVVVQEEAYCDYQGKNFSSGFAYAGFDGFSFASERLSMNLSLTTLPPVRELYLHCYVELKDGLIGPLSCE